MAEKSDYFKTICKVSRAFGTTVDKDELLNLIVESAIETMNGKASCLFLSDEEKDEFIPVAQKGLSEDYFHAPPLKSKKVVFNVLKGGYLAVRDAATDTRMDNLEEKKREGIASILVVPVMVNGKAIGVLSLYTAETRDFSQQEIDFLAALAEQGGMAIENARLLDKVRQNLRLFYEVSADINSDLDIRAVLRKMSENIAGALEVKAASVRLLDSNKDTLKLVASYGLSDEYLNKGPAIADKGVKESLKGKAVIIKNADTADGVKYRAEKKKEGIVSILSVPIQSKNELLGVLRLYSVTRREFTEDDVLLATALAYQGGLAITNASLFHMLEDDIRDMKNDMWSHRSWF